ncbi:MAG: CARDB domain-containing protein [Nitrospirota bacterium]
MKKAILFLFLSHFLFITSVFAQPPEITNGLNYLTSTQNTDGSWGSDITNTELLPSTVSIIETLQILNQAGTVNYSNAVSWLQAEGLYTTDYLSERINALSVAGTDDDLLLSYLDEMLFAWGGYDDYATNNLDTALALQALNKINHPDQDTISYALGYLMNTQNPDGGWGFYQDDDSNVYMTAIVLHTFIQFNDIYDLQSEIDSAVAYLLTKQNPDGGFGLGGGNPALTSTVYETALSLSAFIDSGQGSPVPIQNAINYLVTTQLPNGSWEDDPYSTALALRALANVKPNLSLSSSDLTFSNPTPTVGETISIIATIHNIGPAQADNVLIHFYDGNPSSGGTFIGETTIPSITAYGSSPTSISWTIPTASARTIYVKVDPSNTIDELDEEDNIASKNLTSATLPDLNITPADITFSPVSPMFNEPVHIAATVRNTGETEATNVSIDIYNGDPDAGGVRISGTTFPTIGAGSSVTVQLTANFVAGSHSIYITADKENTIQETNETNNTSFRTLLVGSGYIDLSIAKSDIIFSPSNPVEDDIVTITVTVHNEGELEATNVLVQCYRGDPDAGGVQIGTDMTIPAISARGTAIISIPWNSTGHAGNNDIYIKADPFNTISELNESYNNMAFRTIKVAAKAGADILVLPANITFTPFAPTTGDTVLISATIRNTGTADASDVLVEFSLGDPNKSGALIIGSQTIPTIAMGSHAVAQLSWNTTGFTGSYEIYVQGDPFNAVKELSETNNIGSAPIDITAPQGPDLTITSVATMNLLTDTQTLVLSGSITVTIENKGTQDAGQSFALTAFEDRNGNKTLDPDADTILGNMLYTGNLLAGGTDTLQVPVYGTTLFRDNLIFIMVDSGNSISELDEMNNIAGTADACETKLAKSIQPVQKWAWTGSSILPEYNQVMHTPVVARIIDTNEDGLIDERDIPAVIFQTFKGSNYGSDGVLRAVRGDNGQELFTVTEPLYRTSPVGNIAVGDIDHDGLIEIIAPKSGNGIFAFEHDGTFKWSYPYGGPGWGAIAIADIDTDGSPEIISGAYVLNSTGTLKWSGIYGGGPGDPISLVADINLDGKPELVGGNKAYNSVGTRIWGTTFTDGYNALGNFDADPYPEIVLNSRFRTYLMEHDGSLKWESTAVYFSGTGSAPTIADLNGDGIPEIGVAGGSRYIVFKADGSKLWESTIFDQSNVASSTVFDLDGDGRLEILYADNQYLRIFRGSDGYVLFSTPNSSGTACEYPVVADIDNDSRAEIIVSANDYASWSWVNGQGVHGIRVFENVNDSWSNTRAIWNQHTYHITNVNDDGTIPRNEQNNWEVYNNYRCNALLPEKIIGTADITASYITIDQTNYPQSITLSVRIGNGGAVYQDAGVPVAFYNGDPNQGGLLIGTAVTTKTLNPGTYEDITITWSTPPAGTHTLYAIADKDNRFNECREGNNIASAEFTIGTEPPVYNPDLAISQSDITIVPPDPIEGQEAGIGAVIHNIGNADAYTIEVRVYDGDASTGTLIGTIQIPFIQAGGTSYIQIPWNTFGQSGRNYLHILIDPQHLIEESNENNNATLKPVDVTPPTLPDLTITSTDIAFSHQTPQEGDPFTITATIHNLGTSAASVKVNLYNGNPDNGGTLLGTRMIFPVIPFGGQAQVTFPVDTVGFSGNHRFCLVIDPDHTITEQREDNNRASSDLLIGTIGLTLTETTDKSQYQENEDVLITVHIADLQNQTRALQVDIRVFDAGGFLAATLPAQSITLNPLQAQTLNFTWNTGSTLIGTYTLRATAYDTGMHPVARTSQQVSIISSSGITTNLVLDKISYPANAQARITATVTNESANSISTDLTATITIRNASGHVVLTEDTPIGILTPLSDHTFTTYWNTGTNPPGAYPVTLTVKDQAGTVLSTCTKNLMISSDIKPSVLLRGQISVDARSILQGAPVTIHYSITNIGNIDISQVTLSILTVHVTELIVYDTLTDQTALTMGSTYTNNQQLTTSSYNAKDYLVILRAAVSGVTETLASTYFRVEGAPSAPSLSSPAHGDDVETFTPLLSINNASDPNDDDLIYEFELYADSGLTTLIAASEAIEEGVHITSWPVPVALQENRTYSWRARAYDGLLYGEWMLPAMFRVNLVNEPPTAPTLSAPADATEVDTGTPVLVVNNASDPDSAGLTYNFEVALDPDFTNIVTSQIGIFEGEGTTSWQVPVTLNENTSYYWRAQADDWLIEGPWMVTASFFVNTANDAPTAPSVLSPGNATELPALAVDITVINGTDADYDPLGYVFEIDTVQTFDSPNLIRSATIPEGTGTTTWHVAGLTDNARHYVRAKATDGLAESPWSEVTAFFVNTANDAPTTPVLANPSDGAGVNVFTPTLSVHNAADIDGDVLTYEFELYDHSMNLVSSAANIGETQDITSWTVPVTLTENQTYTWRARAFDGELHSAWMSSAFFMVNTANDAPTAPLLNAPHEGSSIDTLNPTLSIRNATDPDSDTLTYDFEVYRSGTLIQSIAGVPQHISGITSITLTAALADNTSYQWRARAFDGDRYGEWMATATFSIHLPIQHITATIDFDPNTLNQGSNGKWVTVYIELPAGYHVNDITVSSILLANTVPAEAWPFAIEDHDKDGIPDLKVKFRRSDVISILPAGDSVPVHVTGTVGTVTFDGVDIIRVIH